MTDPAWRGWQDERGNPNEPPPRGGWAVFGWVIFVILACGAFWLQVAGRVPW